MIRRERKKKLWIIFYKIMFSHLWINNVRTRFVTTQNDIGFVHKNAQTILFVERGFEKLGFSHQTMVCRGVHIELNRVHLRSLSPGGELGGSGFWPFFPAQPLGALTFILYSPYWLILALHLLIKQVPTSVPVPSAVPPCFLLVAMIEVTLSRRLFSLTRLERWWVHLMRRERIYPEPVSHHTPTWVPFCSHLLQGAFWGQLSTKCCSSLLSLGVSRTGSSSAVPPAFRPFPIHSQQIPSSARVLGPNKAWVGS